MHTKFWNLPLIKVKMSLKILSFTILIMHKKTFFIVNTLKMIKK